MKNRRYILLTAISIALTLLVTGCGDSNIGTVSSDKATTESSSAAASIENKTTTETSSSSVSITEGRELVWSEEFDTDSLDTTHKWNFNQTMSASDRSFSNGPDTVSVANGNLTLTAYKKTDDGDTPMYVTAQGLTTNNRMIFRYGYIEMRAKVPFVQGAWPSFWMLSTQKYGSADCTAEIDIFEAFSSTNKLGVTIHKWKNKAHDQYNPPKSSYTFPEGTNPANEYHLYGMEWTEQYLSFYVDGNLFCKIGITDKDNSWGKNIYGMQCFHDPCYIIINNELFTPGNYNPSWIKPEMLVKDESFPITYTIDYIRLYQKDEEIVVTSF